MQWFFNFTKLAEHRSYSPSLFRTPVCCTVMGVGNGGGWQGGLFPWILTISAKKLFV